MNKQELLPKLIKYYETAIKEMPEDGYKKYMSKLDIENGVCFCARRVFKSFFECTDWIDRNCNYKNCQGDLVFFAKIPYDAQSRTEAISLLQIRVDIMKKELTLKEE